MDSSENAVETTPQPVKVSQISRILSRFERFFTALTESASFGQVRSSAFATLIFFGS